MQSLNTHLISTTIDASKGITNSADDISKGNTLYFEGKYLEALTVYTAIIERRTKDLYAHVNASTKFNLAEAYNRRAATHWKLLQYQAVIEDATKVIELDTSINFKGYMRRGRAHFALKQFDQAAKDYKQALQLVPCSPKHSKKVLYSICINTTVIT